MEGGGGGVIDLDYRSPSCAYCSFTFQDWVFSRGNVSNASVCREH